jgi:hypothetical protein
MTRLKPFAIWTSVALFFALTLSGCFLSNLQPWSPPGSAIFDPALVGTWNLKNCSDASETRQKSCVLSFTPAEDEYATGKKDKIYHIAFRADNGMESSYNGFLFEAGGEHFLQTAADAPTKVDPAFTIHTIPVILVWRVRMVEGKLSLEPLKMSWAANLAASGKLPPHTLLEKDPILNASPQEAHAFLTEHAKEPQAYEDAYLWTKGAAPMEAPAIRKEEKRPAKKK